MIGRGTAGAATIVPVLILIACDASGVSIAEEAAAPLAEARREAGFEILLPGQLSGRWLVERVEVERLGEVGGIAIVQLALRGPDDGDYAVWQIDHPRTGIGPQGPDTTAVVIRGLAWNEQRARQDGELRFVVGRRFGSGVTVAVEGPARERVHELAGSLAP